MMKTHLGIHTSWRHAIDVRKPPLRGAPIHWSHAADYLCDPIKEVLCQRRRVGDVDAFCGVFVCGVERSSKPCVKQHNKRTLHKQNATRGGLQAGVEACVSQLGRRRLQVADPGNHGAPRSQQLWVHVYACALYT